MRETQTNYIMSQISKRALEYLIQRNLSVKNFCANIGIDDLEDLSKLDNNIIYCINICYPDLNINWLAQGDGKMFNDICVLEYNKSNSASELERNRVLILKLIKLLEEKDKQISRLQRQINKQIDCIDKLSN